METSFAMYGLERKHPKEKKDMPSDCHLMYLNLCKCLHDMHDGDGDKMYEFSPHNLVH